MGIEFDVFLNGEVSEEYKMWLPEGYVEPQNFPFTTKEHETLFNDIVDWLDMQLRKLFPHILYDNSKRKKYAYGLALTIHRRIDQTQFLIRKKHNKDNWYRDITNYIEAIAISFIYPQIGFPYYVLHIKKLIHTNKGLNQQQKSRLIDYLEKYIVEGNIPDYYSFDIVDSQTNIQFPTRIDNVSVGYTHLKRIYDQWIDIFPFDLGYFDKDKNYFQQRLLDFVSSDIRQNPYTEMTHHTLKSPKELIEFLIETTKEMLCSFNTIEWAQKATLPEIKQQSYKFEDTEHLLKQKSLLGKIGTNELNYVEILKDWLRNEREYFNHLKERDHAFQEHIEAQPAKTFSDCLICSEDQKKTIIKNIQALSTSTLNGRGWAIVILALYKMKVLTLPHLGKNKIYEAFRKEFGINVSDKNLNLYIGNYLGKAGMDSGVPISDSEIDLVIRNLQKQ